MICTKCGSTVQPGKRFCKNCGQEMGSQPQPSQQLNNTVQAFAAQAQPIMPGGSFGYLLFESNGAGTKKLHFWVLLWLAGAAMFFVIAHVFGHEIVDFCAYFERGINRTFTRGFRTGSWYFFMALGLAAISLAAVYGFIIASLNVKVYEGGIYGKGISNRFDKGDIRTFNFMLMYNQVSASLKDEQTLIIHGPGVEYTIYTKNARDIQFAICQHKGQN